MVSMLWVRGSSVLGRKSYLATVTRHGSMHPSSVIKRLVHSRAGAKPRWPQTNTALGSISQRVRYPHEVQCKIASACESVDLRPASLQVQSSLRSA